jgi:hypothetical protein
MSSVATVLCQCALRRVNSGLAKFEGVVKSIFVWRATIVVQFGLFAGHRPGGVRVSPMVFRSNLDRRALGAIIGHMPQLPRADRVIATWFSGKAFLGLLARVGSYIQCILETPECGDCFLETEVGVGFQSTQPSFLALIGRSAVQSCSDNPCYWRVFQSSLDDFAIFVKIPFGFFG